MAKTITAGILMTSPSGQLSHTAQAFTGELSIELDVDLSGVTTDDDYTLAIDVSQVKAFYILATEDTTLETNAVDATGGNTLNLKANWPYFWGAAMSYDTFKLTSDVTKMYFTKAGAGDSTVKVRCIVDASL